MRANDNRVKDRMQIETTGFEWGCEGMALANDDDDDVEPVFISINTFYKDERFTSFFRKEEWTQKE